MLYKIYILTLSLFTCTNILAQLPTLSNTIYNFTITENNEVENKLLVHALDSAKQNNNFVNGTFIFYINGFTQALEFKSGVATCELKLNKSSFVYFKHENETSNPSNLYYIYKGKTGFNPFKISFYLLLAIPIGLILIGYMFKKIIGLAIFLFLGYLYFNNTNGLSIGTFFSSVIDGLRNIF